VDIFLCGHPPLLCILSLPIALAKRRLAGHLVTTLEIGLGTDAYPSALEAFRQLSRMPNVFFVTYSLFFSEKTHAQTGVRIPAARTLGAHIAEVYMPTRLRDVLVWKYSSECCDNRGALDAVFDALVGLAPGLTFHHLRDLREHGHASYAELLRYRATVFFPYDPALLTFQEFYAKNMPVFAPTMDLGLYFGFRGPANYAWGCTEVLAGHDVLHSESPFDVHSSWTARRFWLQFFDHYQFEHVVLFSNVTDLLVKLSVLDMAAVSARMDAVNKKDLLLTASFYASRLLDLLHDSPADD
jgi:hypothetical protein